MPDKETLQAAMYGPWYWPHASKKNAGEVVPALYRGEGGKTFTRTAIQDKLNDRRVARTAGGKLAFRAVSQNQTVRLFFVEHLHERFSMYTRSMGAIPEGDHTPEEDIHDNFKFSA